MDDECTSDHDSAMADAPEGYEPEKHAWLISEAAASMDADF